MRCLSLLVVGMFALCVARPRPACAQDEETSVPVPPAPPPQAATPHRSAGLALALSIAAPLTGYGLAAAAALPSGNIQTWQSVALLTGASLVIVGPSSGHFYAGQTGRGIAFTAARLLVTIVGLQALSSGISHGDTSESDYDPGIVRTTKVTLAACGAAFLALWIWESADTYFKTDALNRQAGPRVGIAPLVAPTPHGFAPAGLALAGAF